MTLYVRKLPKTGRGVYTRHFIEKGEIIEICPVIPLSQKEGKLCDGTALGDYLYLWGKQEESFAIALGHGSLYNHSSKPNATYSLRLAKNEIAIRAVREILPREQITIDYQWDDYHFQE